MKSSSLKDRQSRRNVLVIGGLLISLSLTSALLLALAPTPLLPEPRSLMVLDSTTTLDQLFDTQSPIQPNRWQYIYIHHSKTRRTDTAPAGDHFLITGATDSADGQVEIRVDPRWTYQKAMEGARSAPDTISICLVGDFDQSPPSEMQLRRLEQLTQALQRRLSIPGKNVITSDRQNSASGLGRRFPAARLRESLLP